MTNAIYILETAGNECYDIFTKSGSYAGLMAYQLRDKTFKMYWDSNASRGSARRFKSKDEALEFMHQRRVKKGWRVQ